MSDEAKPTSISAQVSKDYFVDSASDIFSVAPRLPTSLMLELSNACNHKCIFCANPHMQRRRRHMDTGFVERILKEAAAEGVKQVGFYTTGDPFVHKGLVDFTRLAKECGFEYIYISTNGGLASPEKLKAVIDAGMNSIKFSINAGSRQTYRLIHGVDDWDKVIENLRFVSEYRKTLAHPPRLFATCILTRPVEAEMESFRALVEPLVDEIFITPCGNQSGQMSTAQALLGWAEQFNPNAAAEICALPFNRLHITAEGYLTLCCVDYQNYLTVADLDKMSLKEAWLSPAAQAIRARHLNRTLDGSLCGNCWLGRRDPIAPLVPELADPIDFDDLYRTQTEGAQSRLDAAGKPRT